MTDHYVTYQDILKAHGVLSQSVVETPLTLDRYLSEKYDCHVYLKREDLQVVRSFKLRGAYYAISQLSSADLERGVVAASAGNHAQGVAFTCNELKVQANIFMPQTTPKQKIDQVRYFGGDYVTIHLTGDTFDDAAKEAERFCQEEEAIFIHPFNDADLIAGQGTVAVEIFNQLRAIHEDADYLFTAIGGGGLISGIATYTKHVSPQTQVIGVEPTGASSMQAAMTEGQPVELNGIDKFVDGAAVAKVGEITYDIVRERVDSLVSIDEGAVCTTIIDLYTHSGIVAEPAGALSISALEEYKDEIKGKNVVCVISGGNNDISRMQEIDEKSLIYEGYKHYFLLNFPQRAGALKEFVTDILGPGDDITKFEYTKKDRRSSGPVIVGVELKDRSTIDSLMNRIKDFDPNYVHLNTNSTLYTLLV